MTKGSRVLEKKVNGAQVSNTVFSHLKDFLQAFEDPQFLKNIIWCSAGIGTAALKTRTKIVLILLFTCNRLMLHLLVGMAL